ncbi:MAG: hypothetical protein JNL04_14355 [Rhodospirillaceae bacterium]|nr:hypothetical protein [Rhodospirillaceae bacterium]
MAAFISFLPIIVLMIASRLLPRRIALLVSLGAAILTLAPWLLGTGTAKQFSIVLATLIAASVVWHFAHETSAERWSGSLISAGITLYAFGSIAFGHPFAEQWAHERVPQQLWTHPTTIHIVTAITAVWGAIYVVMFALGFPRERWVLPQQKRSVISLVLVVAGIAFTSWYPSFIAGRPL